jgi:uncharacterized protein
MEGAQRSPVSKGPEVSVAGAADESGRIGVEWPASLDVRSLMADGWRPTPFRQFLLKLHSRCNLACTYCYMYTMADQSWRHRPRMMSPGLVSVIAERIAEHARTHSLESVRIIFHGGEPLLSGAGPLVDAFRKIRGAVDARVGVQGAVQTNGTLLNENILAVLESLGIRVGVSLDGTLRSHDRARYYRAGRGSYGDVARGLDLLADHPAIYAGLLSVVDLEADPVQAYEALLDFAPPVIDFLLPHHNWMQPPPRLGGDSTPYADWLIHVFERWYSARSRETRIRLFEEIIHLLLGGLSETEAVGLTPSSLVVVETDGSIEQTDALKSAYEGAADTGLHIVRDSFDAALLHPYIAARQIGLSALSEQCQSCSIKAVCGAGLYPHRYKQGRGFRNPSVYCPDLYVLIRHITMRVMHDLRSALEPVSEKDGHLDT